MLVAAIGSHMQVTCIVCYAAHHSNDDAKSLMLEQLSILVVQGHMHELGTLLCQVKSRDPTQPSAHLPSSCSIAVLSCCKT